MDTMRSSTVKGTEEMNQESEGIHDADYLKVQQVFYSFSARELAKISRLR